MRRARITTTHDAPETVAAAVRPDNTDEMATTVEDGTVRTRIGRPTTSGLASTVDDYVVNITVADETTRLGEAQDDERADTETHDT